MAKDLMDNKVLDEEQLSTVAGGCRVERDELSRIMFYDPDFEKYQKKYGKPEPAKGSITSVTCNRSFLLVWISITMRSMAVPFNFS